MKHAIASAGIAAVLLTTGCDVTENRREPLPKPGKVVWRSIGPAQFGAMFGVGISPHDSKIIVAGVDMGLAFITRDGGKSWRMLGRSGEEPFGNPGYRGTWGVHFDPKRPERIWIGSTHGLYRSTDGGETWRIVLGGGADSLIHAIATDPTDTNIVYAANGMGGRSPVGWCRGDVWKSVDGGDTWRLIRPTGPREKDPIKNRNWVTVAIDPQSPFTPGKGHARLYLCGQGGFFISEDAGETWASLEQHLPGGVVDLSDGGVHTSGICDMILAPSKDRATIFATILSRFTDPAKTKWLGGVYASTDGGKTWAEKNKGIEKLLANMAKGNFKYSLLVGCRAEPKVMYWSCSGGVYKSEDGGESWRNVIFLETEWKKGPDFDGKEVYWRLRRHGGNFDQSYYAAYGPANGLACSATDPNAVAYTDNAGIAASFDGGKTWTEPGFDYGEAVWPNRFGDRPPLRLTHKVRSRGIQLIVPLHLAVDPFDPKTISIGHCDIGLVISRDNGEWWEWAYDGILVGERNYIRAVVYDPDAKGRMFVAGGGWSGFGHVYRSDDAGRTFQLIGIPQLTAEVERRGKNLYVHALALDPTSPKEARTIYAGTDFGLFKTVDGGKTWDDTAVGLEAVPQIRHLIIDPTQATRLYASALPVDSKGPGSGLYRSDDAGKNWVRLGAGRFGAVKSFSICRATGTIYAIAFQDHPGYWTPRSLWRSDDHGETWTKLDDRLGACVAVHPEDPNRVYYMTSAADVTKEKINVYRSTDGGTTWDAIADGIPLSPGGDGNQIVFDPANPSRLFLLHNSGTFEGVEK